MWEQLLLWWNERLRLFAVGTNDPKIANGRVVWDFTATGSTGSEIKNGAHNRMPRHLMPVKDNVGVRDFLDTILSQLTKSCDTAAGNRDSRSRDCGGHSHVNCSGT